MKKYIQQLKKVFVATKNLPPTFRLIWSTSRQLTLILCILTCLQGVMPTVMIWIGKYVLDEMVIVLQAPNTENIAKLAYLILLQITATLFSLCIARLTKYTNTMFANVLDMSITGRTMKKAVHLDLSYFEIPSFYDKSHRARTEASSRSMTILMNTFLIMQYVVSFIAMVTVLIPLGWILITLAFLTSFPSLFVGIKLGRAGYQLEWDRTQKVRLMGYISSLLMGSHAAKEVRSLGIGDYLYNKWETEKKRYISQNRRIERKRFVGYLLSEGISLVGLAAATAYIIYRAILSQGGVTIGAVMMYISAFSNVRISLNAILNTLSQTYSNSLFIQNLLDFLALQPKIFSCSNALPIPARIEMIEFKNVCFKYPLAKDYALYDVCLTMKRGESILLTGANGAGKSTFVKLLMRLYDPTEGEITINGINLKSYDLTLLRQAFGIIYQDYMKYAFSVRENIGLGNVNELSNRERIKEAARIARADLMIERFPDGYETLLTKMFDCGSEISTGQWQRIALARLFVSDAKVFILDEPTAHLDVEAEEGILKDFFESTKKDRMSIVILHHFSSIQYVDKVLALERGRLIEQAMPEKVELLGLGNPQHSSSETSWL